MGIKVAGEWKGCFEFKLLQIAVFIHLSVRFGCFFSTEIQITQRILPKNML